MAFTDTSRLEQRLGYVFADGELIDEALRHRSWINEHPHPALRNNERLEFLGDAVLNLVIGHLLMRAYPDLDEGELSRMRAGLVNEQQLAAVARRLGVGTALRLGRGERQSAGHDKNSILADALEAVVAAVYLDGGFDRAAALIETQFEGLVAGAASRHAGRDFKSELQERAHLRYDRPPLYRVVDESGPDHEKIFTVRLDVGSVSVVGSGKSKKLAEQDAAQRALLQLDHAPSDSPCR